MDAVDAQAVIDRVAHHAHEGDNETAHIVEDSLYRRALEAIRDGTTSDAAGLAGASLGASLIDFERWYA